MTKITTGILVALLVLAGGVSAQAASKKAPQETTPLKPQLPISIEADELYFSDKTGEMFAKGNVIITQDKTQIFAELMRGNEKNTEIWIDEQARFKEPLTNLTGVKVRYNYSTKLGTMNDVNGKCGIAFISGKKADIQPGKYTLYSASATTCPSKGTPDYHISARKVEIWPGDKLIAYDAKLWIKNTVIYSTPRYRKSLKEDDESDFPRFGFQSQDGFFISQRLSYALSENVSAYTDLVYYTKAGFDPAFGLVDLEKDYKMRLVLGRVRDDNNNLIRKEPEFRFDLNSRQLGNLPVKYTANVIIGQWRDDVKTSWHQEANLYFKHDPIHLDSRKTWTLNLGTGFGILRESYDDSSQGIFRYNVHLAKKMSPALTAWAAYNYTSGHTSVFAYNQVEVPQEGIIGLSWKLNNRTTLSYHKSYDFGHSRVYDDYYTIRQNFHCWETSVTYRAVKKELNWTFSVVKW